MASDYELVSKQIEQMTRRLGKDDAAFAVMASIAAVADALTGEEIGLANSAAQVIYGLVRHKPGLPIPNPWFVFNGHVDPEQNNPITEQYKKSRGYKSKAGTAASVAGAVASVHTAGINVAGTVMHGNATATTSVHLLKIQAIAKRKRESRTIADWCSLICTVKAIKAATRGGQLIGGLIPGGSIPTTVAATVAKSGVKLTYTNVVYTTAAAIHWRAFQEQAISGGRGMGTGGAIGPGSEIFWEIFTKRGLTRLLGNYDIAGLVREPAGWEALADKLLLI